MRRILFGGISLALGAFASPALGQDSRNNSPQTAPQRVARLGQPVAIPATPPVDSGVTPAGLLRRDPVVVVPTPMPIPSGMPTGGVPTPGTGSGVPSIIEDRSGSLLGNPTPMPSITYPGLNLPPGATIVPGTTVIVPSVGPDGTPGLPPGIESPQPTDCPTCVPGGAALTRVSEFSRWRVSGEYLMWWTRAAIVPPLVTASSVGSGGVIGQGDTTTLVGGAFGQTFHSGVRVSAVRWFGDCERNGLEARMFFLGQASSSFTATTGQYPLLARPFINVNQPGGPDSEVVGAVGRANGGVNVQFENSLWGAEANYRRFLFGNGCARVDAIVGYRFLSLTEKLSITESIVGPATLPTGIRVQSATVMDSFRTQNLFNGGQIGLAGEIHRGKWSLDARATVAFGDLNRTADISGGQIVTLANGSVVTAAGGLLALPGANIGRFSDNIFAVVPEVGVNLGYQLTSRLRCFVGYNFMYLGNALRPGDVVDPYLDTARIPNFSANPQAFANPIRPQPQFRSSGIFVQGVNIGLQFSW